KVTGGTQTGRRFRLAGKGMPVLRAKQTGDMYVQVAVETPQSLTKRQRDLLAEFEKLSSEETQPESAGFFSRVKEFLDGLGSRSGSQSRRPSCPSALVPIPVTIAARPAALCTRDLASMPSHSFARVEKKSVRLDDEVKFIRSWIEKPISTGAVMPSSRVLARAMARYLDPQSNGPVIELGPGTGPVTQALVRQGIDPARLVLVEFNPDFCRLLRARYPAATIVQGDAYRLRRLLDGYVDEPAAAVVSGLPLVTTPLRARLRVIPEAMTLLAGGALFVQFTYAMVPPIPKGLSGVRAEASELIWMNLPPARVWVYRGR